MPTEIRHFFSPLAPEELDRYLTMGWRPAGQGIYSADFLRADDEEIYGCLQIRLPLAGFTFRKRHRRLLNQNRRRFRVTYAPAEAPDEELLELNRRYMAKHPAKTREDLGLHVTGEYLVKVLDTHIIRVYDGDQLVAFSYFDLGAKTAYTKAGIYDPAYERFSLGIFTMVLEIEWLQTRGVRYYHPGYVSPRYPVFDYKTQFGAMEYRQISSGEWLPLELTETEDYYLQSVQSLEAIRPSMLAVAHQALVLDYPSFTARFHYQSDQLNLVDGAVVLQLWLIPGNWQGYLITYSAESGQYQFVRTKDTSLRDMNIKLLSRSGRRRFPFPLQVEKVLTTTENTDQLIAQVAVWLADLGIQEN